MKKFDELLDMFLRARDIVAAKQLGLQHFDKHPDMIKFQKARQALYDYVENK